MPPLHIITVLTTMHCTSKSLSLLFLFLCSHATAQPNAPANSTSGAQGSPVFSNDTPGAAFWLESIKHQGVAAFRPNSTYQVFRNVKDFGAKGPNLCLLTHREIPADRSEGDGITDDTRAINLAISDGNRCGPKSCQSSTTSPAVVYFPAGIYSISAQSSIIITRRSSATLTIYLSSKLPRTSRRLLWLTVISICLQM